MFYAYIAMALDRDFLIFNVSNAGAQRALFRDGEAHDLSLTRRKVSSMVVLIKNVAN